MSSSEEINIQNLDHLGIVAGLIDEIGIVEKINEKLGVDSREKITSGQVVKGMVLNGLGMVSRPLYLFSQFFEDKAIEKLLGTGIKSEYLNDDKLGRVMDEIYKLGLTSLFVELILLVIKKFKIVSGDGEIPLFMRAGDGNESDKAAFGQVYIEFKKPIKLDSILVSDSALYSQENLKLMENLKWITRVPLTIKRQSN